jgi:hypothetical protein
MILDTLSTRLPLELHYDEHRCDCTRGLSMEASIFIDDLLSDLHETKFPASDWRS